MAVRIEDLEKRLAALEEEVGWLRQRLEGSPLSEPLAEQGARLLRQAKATRAASSAAAARAAAELGLPAEPMSHEEFRAMLAASGINPDDNAFSREILAMREE